MAAQQRPVGSNRPNSYLGEGERLYRGAGTFTRYNWYVGTSLSPLMLTNLLRFPVKLR